MADKAIKLKPCVDQRKGGNGFGVNEEGAGYTLTGVDRHGVAYKSSNGKGEEVSATLSADDITQSGQGYVNNSVVQCYENHAQDSRVKPIEVSDTRNQKDGTGGNNLPLVVMAYRPPIQDLIAEACAKYGANWPEDDWAEITDEVALNIYTDMDGRRRATAFQKSDTNLEFGVDISYVGDGTVGHDRCFSKVSHPTAPNGEGERWDEREVAQTRNTFDNGEKRCQEVVVSTNSNGEDVAPTISQSEYRMGQNQKDTGGGVHPHPPRGFCLDRFGQYGDREIASAMKTRDYKDHTDLVVHEKEGAEGEVP